MRIEKRVIWYICCAIAIAIAMSFIVKITVIEDKESESSLKRIALCQFLSIRNTIYLDSQFWKKLSEPINWFSGIDLEKVSCGYDFSFTETKLYDYTGAEIVIQTASDGRKYLRRIKGVKGEFVVIDKKYTEVELKEDSWLKENN